MATPAEGDGRGTRERLTRTALRLFAERGYDGVSNREIVEACGLTKGAIYWYFESKEHLFRSVVAENLAAFQERVVGAARAGGTWHQQLAAVFGVFTAVLDDRDDPHRDLLVLLVHRLPGGPGQSDIGQVFQERFASWVESVVDRGDVPAGPHALADLVVSTGLGVLTQASMGRNVAREVLGALLVLLGGEGDVEASPVQESRVAGRPAR